MAEEEFYSSTMRIDISPDLMEQARAEEMAADINKRQPRTVIRIPKKSPMTTMGGQDFNELLQNIYDAVFITDMTGNINSINVRAVQFFQYSREELCQRNILDVLSGADDSLLTTINRTLENDRFILIQAYCSCADGTIFPAEISVNHLHISTKVYLSFFIRDITLRKQAEEQLRTGYNAIQNSITGIAIADTEGRFGYCNPAFLLLLGFQTAEEAQTRNIRDYLCDAAYADVITETILRGEAWGNELEMKRVDGSTFYVQLSVSTNLNPEGEVAGMVLSLMDITERILAQKQLEDYARQLRAKNAEMEDDLDMARELEQAVMPTNFPVFPTGTSIEDSVLQFSHLYRPSGMVGGDFFDIRAVSETEAGIFISDVVGHGMRAALVVATIRGLIEQLVDVAHEPGAFFTQLNEAYTTIFKQTPELMFATAFYMVIDTETGIARYTDAGHPPPFLLRRQLSEVSPFTLSNEAKGPALGLCEEMGVVYKHDEIQLQPQDMILLYTDGISEAVGEAGEYDESGRFAKTLRERLSDQPVDLLPSLIMDAQLHSGKEEFMDDVCLLAVQLTRIPD